MVLVHPTDARIFLTSGQMDKERADKLASLVEKYRARFGDLDD